MTNRSEQQGTHDRSMKQHEQQQQEMGEREGDRKSSQMTDRGNRGNAGSRQGDRETSARPAPGHTRGEERDRKNR